MKELVKELLHELKDKEITFCDLDNYMITKGFYSVYDDNDVRYIIDDSNVVYTLNDDSLKEVIIYFNVTSKNNIELKVINIEEF